MHSRSLLARIVTIIGVLGIAAGTAHAQAAIFDSVQVVRTPRSNCYRTALYTVVEVARTEEVGSDHFIGNATRPCDADSLAADFVVRNEWAEYFAGLRGHFLILDSGTGPDMRGLLVFDLQTRRRTFQGLYANFERGATNDAIGVWQPYDLPTLRPGCPVIEGFGHGVDSLVWLNLRTGKTSYAGQVRCAIRQ